MTDLQACLEEHLVDKAKGDVQVVPPAEWLAAADRHIRSATTIINDDPVGSLVLSWLAMHNIAKAAAASIGYRLVEETHGKVADFLVCIFDEHLTDTEKGRIQMIRGGRNATTYDNPALVQVPLIGAAANLATKLRGLAASF